MQNRFQQCPHPLEIISYWKKAEKKEILPGSQLEAKCSYRAAIIPALYQNVTFGEGRGHSQERFCGRTAGALFLQRLRPRPRPRLFADELGRDEIFKRDLGRGDRVVAKTLSSADEAVVGA